MPIRHEPDDLIAYLNELAALDSAAIRALVLARVPCSAALATHPSVQVGGRDGNYTLGLLGVLNGFCGTIASGPREGWGPIAALLEDDGSVHFERSDTVVLVADSTP